MCLLGQHDIVWPSQRHRISIIFEKSRTRWHEDGNTILTKTVLIFLGVTWPYMYKIKIKKIQLSHNIFLRSLKRNTVKSWRISKKKQLGKRRLQHCFYACSWSITKNSCRSNTISYRYLVCLLLCLLTSTLFFFFFFFFFFFP